MHISDDYRLKDFQSVPPKSVADLMRIIFKFQPAQVRDSNTLWTCRIQLEQHNVFLQHDSIIFLRMVRRSIAGDPVPRGLCELLSAKHDFADIGLRPQRAALLHFFTQWEEAEDGLNNCLKILGSIRARRADFEKEILVNNTHCVAEFSNPGGHMEDMVSHAGRAADLGLVVQLMRPVEEKFEKAVEVAKKNLDDVVMVKLPAIKSLLEAKEAQSTPLPAA